jgi:NADP-dependent 3-hydroxy acid dehydrogenase YdfG
MRIDLNPFGIRVGPFTGHGRNRIAEVRWGYQSSRMCIKDSPLQAEDIADIIHFVVSRPYHVNIADLIVMSTQASSTIVKGINKKSSN